jgi:hypothetical protein
MMGSEVGVHRVCSINKCRVQPVKWRETHGQVDEGEPVENESLKQAHYQIIELSSAGWKTANFRAV